MKRLLLSSIALLLAGPSFAIDLTGTWTGGFKCQEYDGDVLKFKQKDEVLLITQTGQALAVEWVGAASVQGIAIDDAKKPDAKGQAVIADCETGPDLSVGYSELTHLKAKIKREKGKGSLSGTGFYSPGGLEAGVCKWKFKLVDTTDPAVTGCPVAE